jgi:transposase-like protein
VGGQIQPVAGGSLSPPQAAMWISWRMGETYIKVKGQWYYLYRAVDKHGQTIDFLLTEHREAALRFLKKALRRNGLPETITIDSNETSEIATKRSNAEHGTAIAIRQVKYLNKIQPKRYQY